METIKLITKLLLIAWLTFGWAIGGEHGFGKWKRGFLLLPAIFIHGWVNQMPSPYFACQIALAYIVYQCLFYDMCIEAYYKGTAFWEKAAGFLGILLNGLIVSAQPIVWLIYANKMHSIGAVAFALPVWFFIVTWFSNEIVLSYPICKKIKQVKIFCPADSWWLACAIFGTILGVCFI